MSGFQKKRHNFSGLVVISDSDSDSNVASNNVQNENNRNVIYNVDSEDDEYNSKPSANDCNVEDVIDVGPSGITDSILISDDEDKIVVNNRKGNKKKRKLNADDKKKRKKKRKAVESDSGSGSGDAFIHRNVYESDDSDPEEDNDSYALLSRRNKIVYLLNNETNERLLLFPALSANRIQAIISCRPFANWNDLVRKLRNTRGLKPDILNSLDKLILAEDIVSSLMKKCIKLADKIKHCISSKGSLVSVQPALLNDEYNLSSYQLVGLNWLAVMHDSSLNMILADEMGLGKTIQVIAFLAYLKEIKHGEDGVPHLIIVPASTLDNWKAELTKWCPSLKVSIYHGNPDERKYYRNRWVTVGFEDTEIVLTTYDCISKPVEKKLFRKKKFDYIVFDEAHMLKNMNSQRYEAFIQCNGSHKIMLTGTPLQNNLVELISLLNFLMPHLFGSKIEHVKFLFSKSCLKAIDENFEQQKIEQAKKIMDPFMLRRLKMDVLRQLPQKIAQTFYCQLEPDQAQRYKELEEEFKMVSLAGTDNVHMTYLMRLRKLSNHPLLLRYIFTDEKLDVMARRLTTDTTYKSDVEQHIKEDLYVKSDFELHLMCNVHPSLADLGYEISPEKFAVSGKFIKITPLLRDLKAEGHRVLIFSQFTTMLDILQEFLKFNNHMYLRLDGSTPVSDRKEMIDLYNSTPNIFVFLLSTKAGGLGINLTAADTVIIHDIDFNPYNDKQAEDRCHRVGQTKPVNVYKLISRSTVEERIHEIAVKKLDLETEITSNDNEEEATKGVLDLLKTSLGYQNNNNNNKT